MMDLKSRDPAGHVVAYIRAPLDAWTVIYIIYEDVYEDSVARIRNRPGGDEPTRVHCLGADGKTTIANVTL